jgi:hypothetical protein
MLREAGHVQIASDQTALMLTGGTLAVHAFSKPNMEKALVRLFVSERIPFSKIEAPAFKDFCHLLRPGIELFGQDTLRSLVVSDFVSYKGLYILRIIQVKSNIIDNIRQLLRAFDSPVSITVDCWTSPNSIPILGKWTAKGLISHRPGVTGHFAGLNWKSYSITLAFKELEGSHSGKKLSKALLEIFKDHEIMGNFLESRLIMQHPI